MSAALIPAANAATTTTGQLQVIVRIGGAGCSLTTGTSGMNSILDFGTLISLNDQVHDSQTTEGSSIGVQCNNGIQYTIGLGLGLNPPTHSNYDRNMINGSSLVKYQLFQDAARQVGWGDITGPAPYVKTGTGTGIIQKYPVYGRIPVQTTPVAGTYNDTVVVQLQF